MEKNKMLGTVQEIDGTNYFLDKNGRLIPESAIDEVDRRRHNTVIRNVKKMYKLHKELEKLKAYVLDSVEKFEEFSRKKHKVIGGKKGYLTLHDYSKQYKIEIDVKPYIALNESFSHAVEKIENCIQRWNQDAHESPYTQYIQEILKEALNLEAGNVSHARLLSLRKLKIDDPEWKEAMNLLDKGREVVDSKRSARLYKKNEKTGEMEHLSLNFSNV